MEALCHVIGRSIRHSAPGTLRALIRSLGSLTSQGWMLQQNTDQMTAPRFLVAAAREGEASVLCPRPPRGLLFTPVWCFCGVLAHLAGAATCIAPHLRCKTPEGSVTPSGLIWFQRVNWWRGSHRRFWFLPRVPPTVEPSLCWLGSTITRAPLSLSVFWHLLFPLICVHLQLRRIQEKQAVNLKISHVCVLTPFLQCGLILQRGGV